MKYAAPVRKELGVKTLFNILGPLTNPAGARQQVLGVFHPDLVGIQARVLQRLGSRRVMVVHGVEGLDEIALSGATMIAELKDDEIREYTVSPADFGLRAADSAAIRVSTVDESKAMMLGALENAETAARDIVALNAGASIYVAGVAPTLREGVELALQTIRSGAARRKVDEFVAATQAAARA
jgi:anthranilate phosphoribosyltransferase